MSRRPSLPLPPPILTSEPGSFARRTFEVRIPRIIDDTILDNDFPAEIAGALRALHDEIVSGTIEPLKENAPDRPFWDAHARNYVGRSWLDVPWYWAESFFYRRLLEATRYFQPGAWYHRDPHENPKARELTPEAGPHSLGMLLQALPSAPPELFRALLYASLWGNRADLSYNVAQDKPGSLSLESERANLVADDTPQIWEHLQAHAGGRIDFLCDNAGTELLFDLALVDYVLHEHLADTVTLHLKPHPFFVSDAMPKDVDAALQALVQSSSPVVRDVGIRLQQAQRAGQLILTAHWFSVTCLFYIEMPDDLDTALARADLVLCKGDANYRRLLGDAHWDPTAAFAAVVDYMPAPLAALRTLKSEIIVGLEHGQALELASQDPQWLVNGKRGAVQFKP